MNNHKQINNVARSLPKADMSRILAALVFAVTILFSLSVAAISEAELEAELNSGNNFERVNSSEFQFQKGPYIEQGQKSSQNIDSFHARLLQNRPAVVPSEEVTKWIPIAGDITIFVPKKETAYPLAKRVGDQFVQERLVRLQMYNTLGRHLLSVSYSSEAAQIDALYNNAYDLANRSGFTKEFGDQLVQADINPYGLDVIWPEIRRINGEDVLVPVLHLSAQTLENQLVDGHTVEFIGPGAQFNNITIESGSITTRKNALLQAAQNFIVGEGATFTSEGDMNLAVGGTLLNHGQITAEQNINILAGNYVQKTAVHRFHSAHGLGERLGLISTVNAGQSLTIESLSDIAIFGANVQAGNDIVLDAQGNITIGTVALSWQESHGLRNNSYQRSSVEHIRSSLTAGDNIKMMAGGLIEINAATLHADQGHIELLAELGVTIIDELNQQQYVSHREFGNLTEDESSYVTIAMRAVLDAGKGIRIHTADGDITLRATDITSGEGTSVHAVNGAINMLMTVENDHYSYNSIREKLWTITTVSEGHNIDTAVPNTIIGGFQAEALYGVNVEYEGDPSLSHAQQVAALSKMPGMEWMAEIQQQNPDIDWQAVETVYEEWKEKKTSLSPAALAVIAIVVTVCTAGAGAGFVGAGSGSWQAAIANAAYSSMASTAIIATSNAVVNGESFDDVLTAGIEAVHSDDGLKSVATAVVTAGAIWYVDTQFFIPSDADVQALAETRDLGNVVKGTAEYKQLFEELSQFSLGKQALQALTHSTVEAGTQSLIYGDSVDDFDDLLFVSLAQNSVNMIGESLTKKIISSDLSTAMKYIAHGSTSCLVGGLSAGAEDANVGTGCVTAVGANIISQIVDSTFNATTDQLAEEQRAIAEWLEENIGSNALLLDDQSLQQYISSGEFPVSTLYHVQQFSRIRSELQDITTLSSNISRLTAALGAFIAGASATDINIAANVASMPSWAEFDVQTNEVKNALFIHSFLTQQEVLLTLMTNRYPAEYLKEMDLLPDDVNVDPIETVSGEQLAFMMMVKEFESSIGSKVLTSGNEEIDAIEFAGNIDWGNLRTVSFRVGVAEGVDQLEQELGDALYTYGIINYEELEWWVGRLRAELEEIKQITDWLELYNTQRLVVKFGAEAVHEATSPIIKGMLDGIEISVKQRKIGEFVNGIEGLSDAARTALQNDLFINENLFQALRNSPELVNAWKKLNDVGVDDAIKRNPSWLSKVSGWIDEGLDLASEGRILKNGNEVGRIVGDRLHLTYSGHGGNIVCDPNKTTTLLGKWNDPSCGGTCEIIDSGLSKLGQNPGGANVLSEEIPSGWTDQQIWDNVNEPWLRDAANRGDVIRVVSDPALPTNIYKPDGTLSFFGRELELLIKPVSEGGLGYTYNPATFSYVK